MELCTIARCIRAAIAQNSLFAGDNLGPGRGWNVSTGGVLCLFLFDRFVPMHSVVRSPAFMSAQPVTEIYMVLGPLSVAATGVALGVAVVSSNRRVRTHCHLPLQVRDRI